MPFQEAVYSSLMGSSFGCGPGFVEVRSPMPAGVSAGGFSSGHAMPVAQARASTRQGSGYSFCNMPSETMRAENRFSKNPVAVEITQGAGCGFGGFFPANG